MPAGRPRKFTSAKDIYEKGMAYIEKILEEDKHLTYTGLCIALGTTKEVLKDYEDGKYDSEEERFSRSVKELKLYCENYAESRLFANNPTGAIFALKNYGWRDKQEVEQTNINIDPAALTPEDRAKRLADLKAKITTD